MIKPSSSTETRTRSEATFQRASRREVVLLLAYFSLILAIADLLNFRAGAEVMVIAVTLAALVRGVLSSFVRDWWYFLLGLLIWGMGGPIIGGSPLPSHLHLLMSFDQLLFLGHDPVPLLQHYVATPGRIAPVDVFALLTYKVHISEPYIFGYVLWRLERQLYFQFAAAVLIFLILSFVTFVVFPTIPPWLASQRYEAIAGVIKRTAVIQRAYPMPYHRWFNLGALGWALKAAFPSQHAAFPMLEYLALSRLQTRVAYLLLLWIAAVLFSVVYLGEHWVSDVIAGWLYAIAIFWAVRHYCTVRRPAE